jgi:cell shape-determining protein MreC
MNHLDRASVKIKNRRRKALVTLVITLILVVGLLFRSQTASFAHYILVPINNTFHFISSPFSNFFNYFSSKARLQEENYELNDRNKNLEIELLSIKSIKDQNDELREMLNLRGRNAENRIIGQVILVPPFSPFDTFVVQILDKGAIEIMEVQDLIGRSVFIKNNLVGEISEIYGQNIIVTMHSSYGNKIPVKINNEIVAEAEGQGGLSFKIVIPKDAKVDLGTPIFSMNQPGIILGAIKEIEVTETSSLQTIYFQYMFTFSDFNFVEIAI